MKPTWLEGVKAAEEMEQTREGLASEYFTAAYDQSDQYYKHWWQGFSDYIKNKELHDEK